MRGKKVVSRALSWLVTLVIVVGLAGAMSARKVEASQSQVDAIINFANSKRHSAEYSGYCQLL